MLSKQDDLYHCSLDICVDHLYFTTQMTQMKYSTAMCLYKSRLLIQHKCSALHAYLKMSLHHSNG